MHLLFLYLICIRLHPDRHKGNKEKEENFKRVTEAYNTLSNDKARRTYDMENGTSKFGGFSGFGQEFSQGFNRQGVPRSPLNTDFTLGFRNYEAYDFGGGWDNFEFPDDLEEIFGMNSSVKPWHWGTFHHHTRKKKSQKQSNKQQKQTEDSFCDEDDAAYYSDLHAHGYDSNFEETNTRNRGQGGKVFLVIGIS